MVEKCRSVYVGNIDESITYDTVENFFCNRRRSGGGDVKDVNYNPNDGYYIVHFENPSGTFSYYMCIFLYFCSLGVRCLSELDTDMTKQLYIKNLQYIGHLQDMFL